MVLLEWGHVLASHELGQLFLIDVLKKSLLIVFPLDLDLLAGLLVEPSLDDGPDGGKGHGSVADYHLAELLGVVVLGDLGSVLYQGFHLFTKHLCH
jgi:hypothetical protein